MSYSKKIRVSFIFLLILFLLYFFNYRKNYESNRGEGKSYSSNSVDRKAKKDYPNKKEKRNETAPALDLKNNKSEPEPIKEQEKVKETEPSKPKDIKPINE